MKVFRLQHLIASHHGALEFGAGPSHDARGGVLHHADHAIARVAGMADVLASPEPFAPNELLSSRSLWQVDHRRVYRGRSDWGW